MSPTSDKRDAVVEAARKLLEAIDNRLLSSESRGLREECGALQEALDSAPPEERGFTEERVREIVRDELWEWTGKHLGRGDSHEEIGKRLSALEARVGKIELWPSTTSTFMGDFSTIGDAKPNIVKLLLEPPAKEVEGLPVRGTPDEESFFAKHAEEAGKKYHGDLVVGSRAFFGGCRSARLAALEDLLGWVERGGYTRHDLEAKLRSAIEEAKK